MTLTLEQFNGMELLWMQIPKNPDKDHVTINIDDIDAMWHIGIVDTRQFSIETWKRAFDEHKQSGGRFILNKQDFLAKDKYRYKGEIMVPFDAMRINEGKYTDEGLKELFDMSIVPSCSLSAAEMDKFIAELKDEFVDKKNSLIKINATAKMKIKALIDAHPSPLRRMELVFDVAYRNPSTASPELISSAGTHYDVSPEQLARIQASTFSMSEAQSLRSLQKARSKESVKIEASTSIKQVKRSRKGIRG